MTDVLHPRARIAELTDEIPAAFATYDAIAESDLRERADALDEIADLVVQHERLKSVAAQRPDRGWLRFMARGCGPLPDIAVPTMGEFTDVPRRRWVAVVAVFGVLALAIGFNALLPGVNLSPVTIAAGATGVPAVITWAPTIAICLFFGLMVVLLSRVPGGLRAGLFAAAMHEEVAFRLGCENWSARQRVLSCAGFGVAHLLNLVVAFITLGFLALVGGLFMAVYLAEMRRSGDPRRAVWAAARVHTDYNAGVLLISGILVTTLAAGSIIVAIP